jgi:outer membrane protein
MKPKLLFAVAALAVPAVAQEPLELRDAVQRALTDHPSMSAAAARIAAAGARRDQARSGYLPRLQYQESYQRGNNPVYVFGALLTQRQFTEANFDINSLNRPDALNNFQSQLMAEQTVWDFGATRRGIRAAEIGKQLSEQDRRGLELQVLAGVARAYHGVTLAAEALKVAEEAKKSAEADLKRAEAVRDAGMATDADVLSVKVHLASVEEQRIRRRYDLEVGRAALNEALGLPLDTQHTLTTPLSPALTAADAALETRAREDRPEVRSARLGGEMADAQAALARAQLLPRIVTRGILEANRQTFATRGGGNWMFMTSLQWNLFDGNRAKAQAAEAREMAASARAQQRQMENAVALEVRKARADAQAATERIAVSEAAVAQAEETLRILRNRYSAGLATVTDLLRAETALLETKTRKLAAVFDQRMAAINVERAAGTLNGASNVLQ